MSITYLGNIDDRVAAFPWTNEAVDDQYLKDVLMRAALLHSDLAINDGYLINLEAARNGLFLKDIKRPHPLRELIKANFIKILTRNENKLHELPKAMMRQGVNTFGKTIKGIDWPSLAREFENWFSVESRFGPKWVKWPRKDVGSGFVKLLKMIREEKISSDETKSDIFKYVHDRFETLILNESISGARSKWEKITTKMLQEGKLSAKDQLRMMHVANEIYQYNFALCLQAEHESDIYVASRFSPLFEEARLDPKEASDNILHIPDLEIPLRLQDLIPDGKC